MIADRYEILEKVYEGNVATSYRALDRKEERIVLLKVLSSQARLEKEIAQRFQREAMIQSQLEHPGIVQVFDWGTNGESYIAFEYVEGMTLRALMLQHQGLPRELLRTILLQATDALEFAHRQDVVHRDLKPENILIGADGRVKITDFGLAFAKGRMEITEIGTVLGTPAYMSPEQTRGKKVDKRTDLFALGVIIYEALTGENPMRGETYADTMSRVLNYQPRPLAEKSAGIALEFTRFVDRMLEKDPEKRPGTVGELRDHLHLLGRSRLRSRFKLTWALLVMVALFLVYLKLSGYGRPSIDGPAVGRIGDAESVKPAIDTSPVNGAMLKSPLVKPVTVRPAAPRAAFSISVSPWAEVYVDDEFVGTTPLDRVITRLRTKATIRLENPYYPTLIETVRVFDGAQYSFDLNARFASVEILAVPWAVVYVDDRFIDTTPLATPVALTEGRHRLHLLNPHLGTRDVDFTVGAAEKKRIYVDLTKP